MVDNIQAADAATAAGEPGPAGRRRDHRRRRRDRRAAARSSSPKYPDIFWYCNCGAGYPEHAEALIQSNDDGSEISYTAGYATGLAA